MLCTLSINLTDYGYLDFSIEILDIIHRDDNMLVRVKIQYVSVHFKWVTQKKSLSIYVFMSLYVLQ